ncbi:MULTISPECIES: hypothetical protein [unclassified Moraxella]|uniref:hypothetical protein n=1 Tax=unclassified Moraxella TaxID=2685852 RepID=UPI002B4009D8|nr:MULTISPECIES: hypothetical protein [unclassified Moraxella]
MCIVQLPSYEKKEFIFRSRFSHDIRKIFIDGDMTIKNVADKLGWQVCKVSAYYNDKYLLSDDDAQSLSDLLTQIGHKYTGVELQELQKQAVFVDLTKKGFLDEIGEKFHQENTPT